LLRELHTSFGENNTRELIKHIQDELTNFEQSFALFPSQDKNVVLYQKNTIKSFKALLQILLEQVEFENDKNFTTLHKLYDIQETHNLIPHSKVRI